MAILRLPSSISYDTLSHAVLLLRKIPVRRVSLLVDGLRRNSDIEFAKDPHVQSCLGGHHLLITLFRDSCLRNNWRVLFFALKYLIT